ncbi:hypothetical protein Y032_0108g73 [Ancylostoma ceylanicum]|uniref:Peptidase S1 domain-containing protein n=1 Tax=Ancylostoma ceylanicum TaxID=53326 RepID=A0A016TFI5_9BILA|nr:hypothetical protein Y032_0108g73 [Ancylostoma ceylanicum]
MKTLLCLLFLASLWRAESKSDVYDSKTCGLPSEEFKKGQSKEKAVEEPAQEVVAEKAAAEKAVTDDYSPDYKLSDTEDDMEDDPNDPMRTKVMGGVRALKGELPWSVIVDLTYLARQCGGTLISKRHVITAAHCFWKEKESGNAACSTDDMISPEIVRKNLKVAVGATCSMVESEKNCTEEDVGTRIGVKRVKFEHFFETHCNGTNDIAIIELLQEVPKGIHHACLPHLHEVDELSDPSIRVSSSGWGTDPLKDYVNETTPFLQKVDLGVKMTDKECKRLNLFVKEDTFCTYEQSERNGDSGGGITASVDGRTYLLGVISFGTGCDELLNGKPPSSQASIHLFHLQDNMTSSS